MDSLDCHEPRKAENPLSTLTQIPDYVPSALVYDYDFIFDQGLNEDPQLRFQALHEEAPPIFYSPRYGGHWVVLSKQGLHDITLNYQDFTSSNLMLPPAEVGPVLIPATFDPPQHTAYRLPLNKPFSPAGVAVHAEAIRALAIEIIDSVASKGGCDFLLDVAEPFPPTIFFRLAGIPLDNLREFRHLAQDFMGSPDAQVRENAYRRIGEILTVTVKARMDSPRDDVLSMLATRDFGGRKLAMEEILNYAVLLFIGGLDTVVNNISFSVRYLAQHQELQASLRADPSQIPAAIEELLRLFAIATPMRTATRDMIFHGIDVRKGDQFLLLTGAINYDPQAFANPAEFCPHRSERHITFNQGAHRCIGANLARLELRIFFEEWLQRIPQFRLDPENPPTFSGGFSVTVVSLPLLW